MSDVPLGLMNKTLYGGVSRSEEARQPTAQVAVDRTRPACHLYPRSNRLKQPLGFRDYLQPFVFGGELVGEGVGILALGMLTEQSP